MRANGFRSFVISFVRKDPLSHLFGSVQEHFPSRDDHVRRQRGLNELSVSCRRAGFHVPSLWGFESREKKPGKSTGGAQRMRRRDTERRGKRVMTEATSEE